MESYRFKNLSVDQKKRLLLPLSGGVSSLSLLQILDAQLREQIAKQNRTAYEIVVIHLDLLEGDEQGCEQWYAETKRNFNMHEFLPVRRVYEAFTLDQALDSAMQVLNLNRQPGSGDEEFYRTIMASTTSVTTRADIREILTKRLLVALAKQHSCESILWGHSDSRLAAQALADVAKGRGGSVPGALADGPSSDGLNFNYPMRDLFKSELELYAAVLVPNLEPLSGEIEKEPVVSIRNTSIDTLLSNYIDSQGEKYPSIMANVVRTASKLQVPEHGVDSRYCVVCRSSLQNERKEEKICYGCNRMKEDIKIRS